MLLVIEDRVERLKIARIGIEPSVNVFRLDVDDRPIVPGRSDLRRGLVRALLVAAHKHVDGCHEFWRQGVYERLAGLLLPLRGSPSNRGDEAARTDEQNIQT